jgi:peptidyl-prolyl cis-trans isomerase B (cyclophilin B)
VPTTKQRRETARRRLERQIQRRQEAAVKRRRRNLVTAAAFGVVLVLGGVFLLVTQLGGNDATTPATEASASPSATPTRAPKKTSGPCAYTETEQTLANPEAKDVGLPPDPAKTPSTGKVPVTVSTNRGQLVFTLDRAKAPCAVQSFLYLAGKKFFDNTPCPRVAGKADGLAVLQCGAAKTSGGPTYQFKEENLAKASYPAGTIAMANGGKGTTGSQFFVVYEDAPQLGKDYSVIGTVTGGLDVVRKVGAAGNDKSIQAGGGKPNLPITLTSVAVSS